MEKEHNNPTITLLTIIVLAQLLIMVAFGLKIYIMNNQLQEIRHDIYSSEPADPNRVQTYIGNGSTPDEASQNSIRMD